MADFLTKAQRSVLMASIKGKANKRTELVLAALLRRHGLKGWRRHYPIAGKPDFVFAKQKVAIFVDGCFWHGCRWHYRAPTSNPEFWLNKIQTNRKRDRRVSRQLRVEGWKVMRIWDHQLKNGDALIARIRALLADIT
ncbi:very short patch repair endonuclease [Methylacidiphilales bacterium]|nr:very short patch repair endonuclease [Candidatus Methylacidiphilales bacterium]